jgi:hypothetical protein
MCDYWSYEYQGMLIVVTRELPVVFDVEFGDTRCVFVID